MVASLLGNVATYISGMWYGDIYDSLQVGIPVDAEKVNTKTTEEVSLPPSAPHKPIVAEKILISQLDNVAKLVFATTKRLNEVHTFIFRVLYYVLCVKLVVFSLGKIFALVYKLLHCFIYVHTYNYLVFLRYLNSENA